MFEPSSFDELLFLEEDVENYQEASELPSDTIGDAIDIIAGLND